MKRFIKRIVAPLALALGLGLGLPATADATPASPQPYAYGFLASLTRPTGGGTYYCMDELRQVNGDGRPVVLRPCDGSWNQFWFWDENGLIHSTNDGRCLWAHWASGPSDGPDASARDCNGNDSHQRWTLGTDRTVCNGAGACLANTGVPGPRNSYHLFGHGVSPAPDLTLQFDWHHSDSDTPINPGI
ncbi:ricin-type beta-trefoil lectin domain protein [Streptomyces andamanensis]|uniref:Ricin-type beta-trefoil lectin domain protein n=1 Tax=Streptomyces andamanensis TaxID=1565035 RepID=A0ABV8TMW7_9ACTN